ncbi:putative death-receptor fusion protein-domain-containing protein [Gaertneriomyces semiglobifer]|nr:putative death-receptor fusion protein-domain-containing protein [Gaertneriomyces semiglobifer]
MPKSNKKIAQKPAYLFPVRDDWLHAFQTQKNELSSPSPRATCILDQFYGFLSGSTLAKQVAALRSLAASISKLAREAEENDTGTSSLCNSVVLPIFLQANYTPTPAPEPAVRSAIFTVIIKISELPGGTQSVRARLSSHHNDFLQSLALQHNSDLTDTQISYFGAVILTLLDRPLGREVVAASLPQTISLIVRYLHDIVNDVIKEPFSLTTEDTNGSNGNTNSSATPASGVLHLSSRLAACNDVLKVSATLLSRFSADFMTLPPSILQTLLDMWVAICFSQVFLQDNRFLAGFLVPALLALDGEVEGIAMGLLELDSKSVASCVPKHRALQIRIPSMATGWSKAVGWEYSALCIYRGILVAFPNPKSLMIPISTSNIDKAIPVQPLLFVLYRRITSICDHVSESRTRVLAFQTLATWLSVVRTLLLESTSEITSAVRQMIGPDVVDRIFEYIYNGWEDPTDTVQHRLKDVFLGLLAVLSVGGDLGIDASPHLEAMLRGILRSDWHRRVKYDLLGVLLSQVRPKTILAARPDFLENCFTAMRTPMLGVRISAFINMFLKEIRLVTPPDSVSDTEANLYWILPFCQALTDENHTVRRICSESIMPELLSQWPESLLPLFATLHTSMSPYSLHATIAVAKTARVAGLIDIRSFLSTPENQSMIAQSITHPDSNLRVDVLALLCDSQKSTEDFSRNELEVIKRYLMCSLDSQSPEFRQRVQSYLGKLLRRIRRAMYANWRDWCARRDYLQQAGVDYTEDEKMAAFWSSLSFKREFIKWLCDFTAVSLFPGCSFQRATCNLSLMETIVESEESVGDIDNARVSLAEIPNYPTLYNPLTLRTLLAILFNDTYAPNREKALELLKKFPTVEGMSVEEAQRVLKTAFEWWVAGSNVQLAVDDSDAPHQPAADHDVVLEFVANIVEKLRGNIVVAEENLYRSAVGHPLHGWFRALHCILGEISFSSPLVQGNCSSWQGLVLDIFSLIQRASQTVLAVCTDESPEGNLPASFADMQTNMEEMVLSADGDDASADLGSEAQLILYNCFHTIKESTAVLQTIICRAPLPCAKDDGGTIITYDQLVDVGDLLRRLLASIRHRGAFSAVHVCFESLCAVLLQSGRPFLVDLPQTWLGTFLHQIQHADVSITRRSAGLPLGVLAVLTPYVPSRKVMVAQTLGRLFEIGYEALPPSANERLDLPQVHAFNIIRAILQSAELATTVRDSLGDAFALSISGFSSPAFPIRNCAAMLFATLTTKTLGTKKAKDEGSAVNSVTGREFFGRFPKLHGILLSELSSAVTLLKHGGVHPTLYPILTILARLKPSVVEGSDSHLAMNSFRPLVSQCLSATIWKVREMSARAYASLLLPTEIVEIVKELLKDAKRPGTSNRIHGSLLAVLWVVRAHLGEGSDMLTELRQDVIGKLWQSLGDLSDFAYKCDVLQAAFLDVVTEILHVCEGEYPPTIGAAALSSIEPSRTSEVRLSYIPNIVRARIMLLSTPKERMTDVIRTMLFDADYEVQLTTTRYLASSPLESPLAQVRDDLIKLATTTEAYYLVSLESAQLLTILYNANLDLPANGEFASTLLSRLSQDSKPHLAESHLPLLGILLRHRQTPPTASVDKLIGLLPTFASDSQPLPTRLSVIRTLGNLQLQGNFGRLTVQQRITVVNVLLKLLDDEDSEIRDQTAHLASAILEKRTTILPSHVRFLLSQWSLTLEGNVGIACLSDMVVTEDYLTAEIAYADKDVLFAKEHLNSHHEPFLDVVLAASLLQRHAQREGLSSSTVSALASNLKRLLPYLLGQPQLASVGGFALLARIFALVWVLESSGEKFIQDVVREARQALEPLQNTHPVVDLMWQGQWGLIEGVCGNIE